MRQLKSLALSCVGSATVGCAIAIGMMRGVQAGQPSPMSSPMNHPMSPMSPMKSPMAVPAGMPTVKLSANLAPTSEVPAAAVKASGSATVNVYKQTSKVCYRINVTGLGNILGAHIHNGLAGKNGPIVITLATPGVKGLAVGCAAVKPTLLQDLASNPSHYYINVHTKNYRNGAIRGQLAVASTTMMHP